LVHCAYRDLHSFPTRRSSDLQKRQPAGIADFGVTRGDQGKRIGGVRPAGADCGIEPLFGEIAVFESNPVIAIFDIGDPPELDSRSEEHTSELQSREISYAVFC